MENLERIIIIAIGCNSILFCMLKWNVLTYLQLRRPTWFKLSWCFFCISFWLSLAIEMLVRNQDPLNLVNISKCIFMSLASAFLSGCIDYFVTAKITGNENPKRRTS